MVIEQDQFKRSYTSNNMVQSNWSNVEEKFFDLQEVRDQTTRIPYIVIDNFPDLGLITSLKFIEWVFENPNGVVSLPTGKTPEYFIKWMHYILNHWDEENVFSIRKKYGLQTMEKPNFSKLTFVQIDEFYPLDPGQHNSFSNYVIKYYLKGFNIPEKNALLINSNNIKLYNNKHWSTVFPNGVIDLSLRYRESSNDIEKQQQESIYLIDQWCNEYEQKIRSLGGIGFFLGGIGPDGHIAFNVRGSDHNSTTRLMETNFETQATAATDLGGIEISANRLVITIGLGTITYNKNVTAIVIAAGESKSSIIKQALESDQDVKYPATVLQKIINSRFYITKGASKRLLDMETHYWETSPWTMKKKQRALLGLAIKKNKYGKKLTLNDLTADSICKNIPRINNKTVPDIINSIDKKVQAGIKMEKDQIYYHTGPHHDDIMLGMMPHIIHLIREPSNKHIFANMTSGFTSVTNGFLKKIIQHTLDFFNAGKIQMTNYNDFFTDGYLRKWDKDVYHYLDRIANNDLNGQKRGVSHRIVRSLINIYCITNKNELKDQLDNILIELDGYYDGEKNSKEIQKLKGMIREFEEELVWANYGVRVKDVHHLKLGFYKGDMFTEQPQNKRDVTPVLEHLRDVKPTVISLAMDPEGSGPDTHYKVLQTIAEAVRRWNDETDLSNLRIWGYRNVWYRFDLAEADIIIPVTLNSMAILNSTFSNCYLSQKDASFPSYEYDGPFSELSQRIWVEQHHDLQLLLGRDYWYQNENPHLRAVHGAIYLKEMNVNLFLDLARRIEDSTEGSAIFNR